MGEQDNVIINLVNIAKCENFSPTFDAIMEILRLRDALEKAANQMSHFTDCPFYTWKWEKKNNCADWCDNKDETAGACWMLYFKEDKK